MSTNARADRPRLLIVGDYPPPYGGVSVQIASLRRLLPARADFDCRVLDIGQSRRVRRPGCLPARNALEFLWVVVGHAARQYTIHLYTNGHQRKSWLVAMACACAGLFNRRRTVLTLGSGAARAFILEARPAVRMLIRAVLIAVQAIVVRNEATREAIVKLGIRRNKIVKIYGFCGLYDGGGPIPAAIEDFLGRHPTVLAAMGSPGPEYGIPLIVEAAARLRPSIPGLGLVLIGQEGMESHGLGPDLLVTGALDHEVALRVMQRVNVFVRPTYHDGDASSVREALALGVAVVASDTDFRPRGVTLFRRGDADDLLQKISNVLRDGPPHDAAPRDEAPDAVGELIALHDAVRGRRASTRLAAQRCVG